MGRSVKAADTRLWAQAIKPVPDETMRVMLFLLSHPGPLIYCAVYCVVYYNIRVDIYPMNLKYTTNMKILI